MKGLFNLSLSGSEERNLDAGRQALQRRDAGASIFRCDCRRRFALADSHLFFVNLLLCARRILAGTKA